MLEAIRYACSNWLITPAAPAVNETPPTDVREQRFLLVLSGVALFDLRGENGVFWKHDTAHIRPDIDPALAYAVQQHQIPAPPGNAGLQYTRQFQVEQIVPFAGLASISNGSYNVNLGWAADAWRPQPYETMIEAVTQAPLARIFAGIQADIAVREKDAWIQRLNFQVSLIGTIAFAAVIIT